MRVFNEESDGKPGTFVLILDKKEARELTEMSEAAVNANPRKKLWKKVRDEFHVKLGCW